MAMTDTTTLGREAVDVAAPAKTSDDMQLYSVTTIIDALDKPALRYWAAETAAAAAVDNDATWHAMLADRGREEAVIWLRDAINPNRRPKLTLSAANLGTVVHRILDDCVRNSEPERPVTGIQPSDALIGSTIRQYAAETVDIADETRIVVAMLEQVDNWLHDFTPTYQATEVAVYNEQYGYAGQLDALMTLPNVKPRLIVDYKTSRDSYDRRGNTRRPYSEACLQLAGYRHAQFAAVWRPRRFEKQFRRYYLLSADERAQAVPVPTVDAGMVIHITPEHCHAYPARCDATIFDYFLHTLECFRWMNEDSQNAIAEQPLTPR